MALVLKTLAKLAIQKFASDPQVRRKAMETVETVTREAKNIASEKDDKAHAAGKAFSQVMRNLKTPPRDR